jgi:hypothetical protein
VRVPDNGEGRESKRRARGYRILPGTSGVGGGYCGIRREILQSSLRLERRSEKERGEGSLGYL